MFSFFSNHQSIQSRCPLSVTPGGLFRGYKVFTSLYCGRLLCSALIAGTIETGQTTPESEAPGHNLRVSGTSSIPNFDRHPSSTSLSTLPNNPATVLSPIRVASGPVASHTSFNEIDDIFALRHLRVILSRAIVALCFFAKGCASVPATKSLTINQLDIDNFSRIRTPISLSRYQSFFSTQKRSSQYQSDNISRLDLRRLTIRDRHVLLGGIGATSSKS